MNKEYRTSNLGEAACLLVLGFLLSHTEETQGRVKYRTVFVFLNDHPDDESTAAQTAADYRNSAQLVDALTYFNAVHELKSSIYSQN